MKMKKQVHVFNIALVSIVITLGNVSSLTSDEKECLKSHSVWKASRGKCSKECKVCPFGTGRNFTSIEKLVRKSNGDLRCPPCEECQAGYYSIDRVTCRQCVVDCRPLKRHVQLECTKVHDVSCGSCLPGFYDGYYSTDLPCLPNENDTPNRSTSPQQDMQINEPQDQDANGAILNTTARAMPIVGHHDRKTSVVTFVVVSCVIVLAVASFAVIGSVLEWRISDRIRRYCRYVYNRIPSRESLDDLETDGDTGRKIANYHRQDSNDGCQKLRIHNENRGIETQQDVRGEIQSHAPPAQEVPATSAIKQYHWQNAMYQNIGRYCKCEMVPGCQCCFVFRNGPDRLLERSDSIIRYVATHICHNPNPLFEALGVLSCKVYQLNDTRDRDPIGFSEAEMVLGLLNSWVERVPDNATLKTLCKSLCQTGFHDIVKAIKAM